MLLSKSQELLDPNEFSNPIILVGLGALGSNIALNLARMGLTDVDFYDGDIVEEKNLNNQAFDRSHIGKTKAHSCYLMLHKVNLAYRKVNFHEKRFLKTTSNKEIKPKSIVIMAVDKGRKEMWEWLKNDIRVDYIIETGMAHGTIRVQTADKKHKRFMQTPTLEQEENGGETSACGETLSIPGGPQIIAGLVANEIRKIGNGVTVSNSAFYMDFYPYFDTQDIPLN